MIYYSNPTLHIFFTLQCIQTAYQFTMIESKYINKRLRLSYKIEEELPPESLITNLITDLLKLNPTHEKLNKVRFDAFNSTQIKLNLYEINKDHRNLVKLNSQNGDLLVANRIDRETICPNIQKPKLNTFDSRQIQGLIPNKECLLEYAIFFILYNNTEELWIPLSLFILDINDNRPIFLEQLNPAWKGWYEVEIVEDAPVGYKCLLVKAIDADIGDNAQIEYEIRSLNDSSTVLNKNPFKLLTSGTNSLIDIPQLILTDSLDYEVKQRYILELEACEPNQVRTDCARIHIEVLVKDMNDNAPSILFPPLTFNSLSGALYQTNISENQPANAVLFQVRAQDLDSGDFGRVTFYLKSESNQLSSLNKSNWQSYLQINADSGELRLAKTVQAHEISQFRLIVCAKDNGPTPLECCFTLIILIQDVNNHAPDIQLKKIGCGMDGNTPNEIYVPSNIESGTHIGLLVVSDLDRGSNGKVVCHHSIMNNDDFGELTGLTIQLIETGQVSDRSLFVLQVEREQVFGTKLLTKLEHARSVDKQHSSVASILISCNDLGQSLSLTSSVILTIRIVQFQDLNLCFEQKSYQLNVEESDKPMSNLIRPQLQDLGLDVRFSIFQKSGQHNGCEQLEIDLLTGELSAPRGLDRERSAFMTCSIVATEIFNDKPTRTAVAEIVINLTDVNDNAPHLFNDIIQNGLTVMEWDEMATVQNSPILHPYIIGFLNAQDVDAKENGTVKYYLKKVIPHFNNYHENKVTSSLIQNKNYPAPSVYELPNFQLDSESGLISLRRDHHARINRELISSFDLEILLQDNGSVIKLSTLQTVKLNVLDVNDNEPNWMHTVSFQTVKLDTSKEVGLFELDPIWTYVEQFSSLYKTQLEAFDLDVGENGRIRMSLVKPEENLISNAFGNSKVIIPEHAINMSLTGEIYLNTKHLSFEFEYVVLVRVQDNGARRVLHSNGYFAIKLPLKVLTFKEMALRQGSKFDRLEIISPTKSLLSTEELRMLVIVLFSLLAIMLLFGAVVVAISQRSKSRRLANKTKHLVQLPTDKSPEIGSNQPQPTDILLGSNPDSSYGNTYPRFDTTPTWMSCPYHYMPTLSTENTMNSLYISQELSPSVDYQNTTIPLPSQSMFIDQGNYSRSFGLPYTG